jgi:cytoskeletal protein CcmA (bactofilin family)
MRDAGPDAEKTYFDESAQFSGTLHLRQSVCIDGAIEGEIDCEETVRIGPAGRVTARIRAQSVVIEGEVHGDIESRGEITLHKTARVFGDMTTEGIVVEKGAKVEGRITIGSVAASPVPPGIGAVRAGPPADGPVRPE